MDFHDTYYYSYGISVDEEEGIILATGVNKDEPIIKYKVNERNIEMVGEERTANVLLVHYEPSVP